MKNHLKKIVSIVLIIALIITNAGFACFADSAFDTINEENEKTPFLSFASDSEIDSDEATSSETNEDDETATSSETNEDDETATSSDINYNSDESTSSEKSDDNETATSSDIDNDIEEATQSDINNNVDTATESDIDVAPLSSDSEANTLDEELFGTEHIEQTDSFWGQSWGSVSFLNKYRGSSTHIVYGQDIEHNGGNYKIVQDGWDFYGVRTTYPDSNTIYCGPLFRHWHYSHKQNVYANYWWERWNLSGNLRSKIASSFGWAKKMTFDGSYFTTVSMEDCFLNNTLIEEVVFNNNLLIRGNGLTSLKNAFNGCINLKKVSFGNMTTTGLTTMEGAFEHCINLEEVDFGSTFDISNVTNMAKMFRGCTNLKKIVLPKNFAANVTDLHSIFEGCSQLTSISVAEDVRGLPAACDANGMFDGCISLIGGGGFKFDSNFIDGTYARVDYGGVMPGYLSCTDETVFDSVNIAIDNTWCDNVNKANIKKIRFATDSIMQTFESNFDMPTTMNNTLAYTQDGGETLYIHFARQIKKLKTIPDWSSFFASFTNLEDIDGLNLIDTSVVTNMTGVFKNCSRLRSVALGDIDIKNVTTVESVFENCTSLVTFTGHIASFSSLQIAKNAFKGCSALPVYSFDICNTQTLTDVTGMFDGCSSLRTIYVNDNFAGLPTSIASSSNMFRGCVNLVGGEGFNYNLTAPITDGSVANVDYGGIKPGYFTIIDPSKYADALFTLPTNWYDLHAAATKPKSQIKKIKFYNDAAGIGNYDHNFYMSDTEGTRFFIEGDTVKIHYGHNIPKLKVSGDWSGFFKDFTSLTTIEGLDDKIDTTEVTNMSELFSGCTSLRKVAFNPNTPNVTNMSKVFYNCASLSEVKIGSNLKLDKVENLESAYENCVELSKFDIGIANFSSIKNLKNAFKNCKSLTRFKFDVCALDHLTTTEGMFSGCTNLTTIYVSDSFQGLPNIASTDMFKDCVSLVGGQGFAYSNGVSVVTDGSVARVDYGGIMPGYYTIYGTPEQIKDRYSHAQFNLPATWFDGAIATGINKDQVTKIKFYNDDASGSNIGIGNYDGYYQMSATEHTVGYYENEKDGNGNPTGNIIAKIHFGNLLPHLKVGKDFSCFFKDFKNVRTIEGIDKLNLSAVEDMSELFSGCENLESISIIPDTSHVKDMDRIFYNCKNLKSVNLGVNVNLGNVETFESAFENCEKLTTKGISIKSTVPLSRIKSFKNAFKNCKSLTAFTLNAANSDTLTDIEGMFNGCENLLVVNASSINLTNVESTKELFSNCKNLNTLITGNYSNLATVSNLEKTFYNCESLTELPPMQVTSSRITTMKSMFAGCTNLTKLGVGNAKTDNLVEDGLKDMFLNCKSATSIILGEGFVLGNATDLSNMFNGCENLVYLDLSHFSSNDITDMTNMFRNNKKLETIIASSSFAVKGKLGIDMFLNCDSLEGSAGTIYNKANVTNSSYAQVDGGSSNPGYFSWGDVTLTFLPGNDCNGTMEPITIKRGLSLSIECGFSRDGHTFTGWKDDSGNFHDTNLVAYRTMTLTAVWERIKNRGTSNGGGGKNSGVIQNQERALNFILVTPINEGEYTWIYDNKGVRSGLQLNANSVVGKAMLNSNKTKGAFLSSQDGKSILLGGGGLYRIRNATGEECIAFDNNNRIMTGFVVTSFQTKVLNVASENIFGLAKTNYIDENKVFIEAPAGYGKYYLYEKDDFKGRLWNQPISVNGVNYLFDTTCKVISSSDSPLLQGSWEYHPIENQWKYYIPDMNGAVRYLTNTSYDIYSNGAIYKYIFDINGNLMKGYFTWQGQNYYGLETGPYTGAATLMN